MTLDEAEKMCCDEIADLVTGTNQRDYRGAMRGYNLARFILAAMPVLRMSIEWREYGPGQSHCDEEGCRCIEQRMREAVDTLTQGAVRK